MSSIIKYEDQNMNHLKSLAKIAFESKQYANLTETSLLNLMLSAQDLGISPMKAINGSFYIVNGKVCMSTALMADRIRKAGHSIKVVEMTKEKCVIVAVRKDNQDSIKCDYTWDEAQAAGLTGSPTWKKFPKIMLYNRCMSMVARILFPDVVGNSYSEEERFDIANIPSEKRPLEDAEAEMIIGDVLPVEKEELSEEQCKKLESLLEEDPEAEMKIRDTLGINSYNEMTQEDYARAIKFLERRKENRDNGRQTVA